MADQHLGKFWKNNNFASNRAKKLIESFIYNLENCTDDKENTNLILAGDIYDSIHTNAEMLVYIKKRLNDSLNKFNHIYVIAGNHETFIDKSGEQQTLLSVALDSNKTDLYVSGVYSKILEDGNNYIFIPHQTNVEDMLENEVPKHLKVDRMNIIIAHTTPKEVFSYEKLCIADYIDKYNKLIGDKKLPYIILGHYHFPMNIKCKDTEIISVGNSYYLTVADLRQIENPKYYKRYLILSNNKITSKAFVLPKIWKFDVDSQDQFDKEIVPFIKGETEDEHKIDINDIIYLRSNMIIDYSVLMFDGYDVYFDMLENTEDGIITLKESLTENITSNSSGKTLLERWDRYIELIPDSIFNENEKKLATWLFSKRNDCDISLDQIRSILGGL